MEKINNEIIENKFKELGWMKDESKILLIDKDCAVIETYTGRAIHIEKSIILMENRSIYFARKHQYKIIVIRL